MNELVHEAAALWDMSEDAALNGNHDEMKEIGARG